MRCYHADPDGFDVTVTENPRLGWSPKFKLCYHKEILSAVQFSFD